MKTIAIIFAILLACTACVNDNRTLGPITAAVGEQFVLTDGQIAQLNAEGLDGRNEPLTVQLSQVNDYRAPTPYQYSAIGLGVLTTLVFEHKGIRKEIKLCIDGLCPDGDSLKKPGRHGVDSSDVKIAGIDLRVFLSKVKMHPSDEYDVPARQRQPKRATLLVKRI